MRCHRRQPTFPPPTLTPYYHKPSASEPATGCVSPPSEIHFSTALEYIPNYEFIVKPPSRDPYKIRSCPHACASTHTQTTARSRHTNWWKFNLHDRVCATRRKCCKRVEREIITLKKCHEPHKSALQTPSTRMSIYYSYCNFVLTLKLMFM